MSLLPADTIIFLKNGQRIAVENLNSPNCIKEIVEQHECGKLYVRYKLVNADFSGITEHAVELITKVDGNEDPSSLLETILKLSAFCNGAWVILHQKGYYDEYRDTYEFEANSMQDAGFQYARFLYEMGLIEQDPSSWVTDGRGVYVVTFSELGKNVLFNLRQGAPLSSITPTVADEGASPSVTVNIDKFVYTEDNSVRNTSLFGSFLTGGRSNDQRTGNNDD